MQIISPRSSVKSALCVLAGVLFSPTIWSASDYPITVDFTGEYFNETCEIRINGNSNNESVTLPRISNTALKNNGGEGGKTGFTVTLEECPGNQVIALMFNSNYSSADVTSGNLLNQTGSGFSKRLQLRLRKADNSQMIIDDQNTADRFRTGVAGTPVTHQYYVTYYSKSGEWVTAGKVHAVAGITLEYQ